MNDVYEEHETRHQNARARWMADIIACSTLDARPAVVLRPPVIEDNDNGPPVRFIPRRCPMCRIRDMHEKNGIVSAKTCGTPECRTAYEKLRSADELGPGGGPGHGLGVWRRRKPHRDDKKHVRLDR